MAFVLALVKLESDGDILSTKSKETQSCESREHIENKGQKEWFFEPLSRQHIDKKASYRS